MNSYRDQFLDLGCYLKTHWTRIKGELLEGEYKPGAVRKVEIPKPNGGKRQLGIPTVMDRLIQQAIHQALEPIFDPEFSHRIAMGSGAVGARTTR